MGWKSLKNLKRRKIADSGAKDEEEERKKPKKGKIKERNWISIKKETGKGP